jgi:hypothetical protein
MAAPPELFDPVVDAGHRSYRLAVDRASLHVLRPRPPEEHIDIDHRWLQRFVLKCSNIHCKC